MLCQGKMNVCSNVREFYNFQLVSNDDKQKMESYIFLTILDTS